MADHKSAVGSRVCSVINIVVIVMILLVFKNKVAERRFMGRHCIEILGVVRV